MHVQSLERKTFPPKLELNINYLKYSGKRVDTVDVELNYVIENKMWNRRPIKLIMTTILRDPAVKLHLLTSLCEKYAHSKGSYIIFHRCFYHYIKKKLRNSISVPTLSQTLVNFYAFNKRNVDKHSHYLLTYLTLEEQYAFCVSNHYSFK